MCPPSFRLFGDGGAGTMFMILRFTIIRPKLGKGRDNTNNLILYGEMPISARGTCSYIQIHHVSLCTKGILLDAGRHYSILLHVVGFSYMYLRIILAWLESA